MATTWRGMGRAPGRRERRAVRLEHYIKAEWHRRRQLYRWARVALCSLAGDRGWNLASETWQDIAHYSARLRFDCPGTFSHVL